MPVLAGLYIQSMFTSTECTHQNNKTKHLAVPCPTPDLLSIYLGDVLAL